MKQEENKDVESRILKAAEQVFTRKGFEATTMGDIANEAGIGRTSLNYYFRTKEMLFEAILGNLMGMILPNITQIVDEETPYQDKIRKIIRLYLQTIRKNDAMPLFVINEFHRDPQHLFRAVVKDPVRIMPIVRLRQFVEEGMERGTLRKIPIIDLVSTLVSLVAFPFLIRRPLTEVFLNGREENFEEFLDRRTDFIYGILEQLLNPNNK